MASFAVAVAVEGFEECAKQAVTFRSSFMHLIKVSRVVFN